MSERGVSCSDPAEAPVLVETLFVSLPALPSHPPAALQDLLTSLASASRGSGIRVCLLFWLPSAPALSQRGSAKASGVGSLGEALPLPAAVRKLCEIQSFTLPTTSETWDTITLQVRTASITRTGPPV